MHLGKPNRCFQGSFFLNSDGSLAEAESYWKSYEYLPRFNLPILEKEENGLTFKYIYKPETNLLTAKFTCNGEEILKREFFFYDEDHLLIGEVVENDTERHSKRYQNDSFSGLPILIEESDFDLATGAEFPRRSTQLHYNQEKLVEKEDYYDAEGVFRYSIFTTYDSQRRVASKTTPSGEMNTYSYDVYGKLQEIKEVGKSLKRFTYDPAGYPISVTKIDAQGNKEVSFTKYDPKGRLLEEIDVNYFTTFHTYDSFGHRLTSQLPELLDETATPYTPLLSFAYDVQGNLIEVRNAQNETITTAYNLYRKPTQILQPDGSETLHFYNKEGTLAVTQLPDGTKIDYTYDPIGRMTSKRVFSSKQELLSEEKWSYDAFHLLTYTDPRHLTTKYTYNIAGRKSREEAEERKITYEYDPLGFLQKTTFNGVAQVQICDYEGRICEQWEEDQEGKQENLTRFVYEEEGRIKKILRTTSQGIAEDHLTFDDENRLRVHVDPLGAITKIVYRSLTKTTIDPLKNVTIEVFDPLHRLLCKEQKNSQGETVSKEERFYDRAGNLAKRLSTVYLESKPQKSIAVFWEYDSCGRLIKEVEAGKKTTTFAYDSERHTETKTLSNGVILEFTYDGLDRILELKSSDASIHYEYVYQPCTTLIYDQINKSFLEHTYNIFGQLVEEVTPNNLCYQWDYDPLSGRCYCFTLPDRSCVFYQYSGMHLSSIQRFSSFGTPLYEHRYLEFDPNGHVSREAFINHLGIAVTEHDLLERPSSYTTPWHRHTVTYGQSHLVDSIQNTLIGDKTYTYNALNQLRSENATQYQFDSLGNPAEHTINDYNQILSTTEAKLDYDENGNLIRRVTSKETISYAYDALNRLISISTPKETIYYTYDPLNRLLSKQSQTSKIEYLYDQSFEIGSFSDTSTQLKVLGLGVKGDIGAAIVIELDHIPFVPLHDFSGNIIALVASSGTLAITYDTRAFTSTPIPSSSSYFELAATNPWRFASKRYDEGLLFFGFRFYDPTLGRWLTPDPLGFAEGPNPYLFVQNNPLSRLDLLGLSTEPFPVRIELPIEYMGLGHPNVYLECEIITPSHPTKGLVRCTQLDKIIYTDEELRTGKVNLLDHFSEILPVSVNKVVVSEYLNGILNKLVEFKDSCSTIIPHLPPDLLFIGIHNRTCGLIGDTALLAEHLQGNDTFKSKMVREFYSALGLAVNKCNPQGLIEYYVHSEGGILTKMALESMTGDLSKIFTRQFCCFAFGPVLPISNKYCFHSLNIYSKNDKATLHYLNTGPYLNNKDYDIKFVGSLCGRKDWVLWFADHTFLKPTYQGALKREIEATNWRR